MVTLILSSPLFSQDEKTVIGIHSSEERPSVTVEGLSWPREFTNEKGNLTVFQPQLEKWISEVFEATAAIALLPEGEKNPIYGFFRVKGNTYTNLESRVVTLFNLKITEIEFKVKKTKKNQELQALGPGSKPCQNR